MSSSEVRVSKGARVVDRVIENLGWGSLAAGIAGPLVRKDLFLPHRAGWEGFRLPDGAPVVILEPFQGTILYQLLVREGPLSPARAVEITLQSAKGLRFLHERRIVHQDLSKFNLTERGVIFDLGIAKIVEGPSFSCPPAGRGTAGYTAPECFYGSGLPDPSFTADIFSLGCCLREMLAGRPAFPRVGKFTALIDIRGYRIPPLLLSQDLPPSSGLTSDAADSLGAIIYRMIAYDPRDRYQKIDEVIEALEGWQKGRGAP